MHWDDQERVGKDAYGECETALDNAAAFSCADVRSGDDAE